MQDESLQPDAASEAPIDQPPARRRQGRATKVLAVAAIALTSVVLLGIIAIFVITNTDWGRERVRRVLVSQIQKEATGGTVRIGRVSGNLLEGMTVHDLVITDSAGNPFIAVDSLKGDYAIRDLLRKRVNLDDVLVVGATIVLDRQPGAEWNWKLIFPADTLPAPLDTTPGFGDFLRFTDVTLIDGHVVVRSPWEPSGDLTRAQRDSAVRSVLTGGSRLMVVRVPTGFQKIVELRDIDAKLPLVQLADPALAARLIDVTTADFDAYPFRPPAAEVTDLRGRFHFTGDSLWWRDIAVRMPGSRLTGDGLYNLDNGDMWIHAVARPLAHADFRWIFPRLPSRGGGPLTMDLVWSGASQRYDIRDADLRIDRQRLQGDIAIRLDGDVTIDSSNLQFANIDTRTLEQVVGGFDIPRRGTLTGRARLRGTQAAMHVDANVAFDDAGGTGRSRIAAVGQVGYTDRGRTYILRARNLRLRLLPLRLELAQAFAPGLPIGGALTGNVVVDGASNTGVTARGSVVHTEAGNVSRIDGRAMLRFTERMYVDADVRLEPLAMATATKFAPDLPLGGTLSGPVRFRGTLDAFTVSGNVTHREGEYVSRVSGDATVRRRGETFIDADVRLDPLAMATAAKFAPDLRLGGSISGPVRFRGTLDAFSVSGDVTHREGEYVSRVSGDATVRRRGETFFDADVRLDPLAMPVLARYAPDAQLRGSIAGPVELRGTTRDFAVSGTLALAGGGTIAGSGRIRPAGDRTAYALDVGMSRFDPSAVSGAAPQTNLNGRVIAEGAGFEPATMHATVALNLDASSFEGASIDSAVGRLRIADGLAAVQRLQVRGAGLVADARGTFGLRQDRTGQLTFSAYAPSIAPFEAYVPGATEGQVEPRPGVLVTRERTARADSARIARATEVERAVTGRPSPQLVVDTPRAIPRGTVQGALYAAGTLVGNIHDFDARGRVAGEDLVVRGHAAGSLRAEVAVTNAMTTRSRLSASARGEDLVISGFALDSAEARVGYTAPDGRVAVALWQSRENDYALAGDFSLQGPRNEFVAREVRLRFDTTLYRNPAPFAVRWGGTGGVEVDNLLLENQRGGRVYADGRLPIDGSANLGVAVTDFEIADALALTQSDLELTGLLTVEATVRGPASNPVFQGAAALATPRVDTTRAPNVRGTFAYANRVVTGQFEAVNDAGAVVATIDAEVPANLAFTGVTGDRFPETGMRIDVAADSLPLGVVALATDVVSDVSGVATGRVALRGSFARPEIVGGLAIRDGAVTVTPLGIEVTEITGLVRMAGDTVVIDSLAGRSDGRLFVRGGLGIGNWREPSFDLYLVADDARILDNDQGELRASAGLALRGPFTSPYLSGQATVEEGVIFIPAGPQKRLISSGDPAVFAVLDTSVMSDRELLPGAEATLLRNLRADVDVVVNRNTWVRSREANIEIYTEEPISAHYENEAVALTGILSTERGEYELLSKRFEVSSGSALFIGLPEINPTIQLTAQYEVRLPSRPAINIRIVVGGTLRAPRITLESDAQPPLSQTDLMSLVAFGTESSSLVAIAGSALTAEAGNAFSTGLAATRLAAVALGMAVEEVEMSALRQLGVDVFNIRPADVPFFRTTGSFEEFLLGTEFEIGKYVDPRTFVAVETVLPFSGAGVPPGVRVQHRRPGGYRYEAFYGPRFLLREPTLREQDRSPVAAVGSFGILLSREWRF